MRADSCLSHTISTFRLLVLVLLALAAAGCKTEKSPDQPTLLGIPPTTAYLGVRYYYNWGAYGGENILDYSLTNAPSWLALEDTSNKARPGIIMAGVPGLTGGSRGEADLRKTDNINLVTNDGKLAGNQSFSIEVRRNVLKLDKENTSFEEGVSAEEPEEPAISHCATPDLSTTGQHQFAIDLYNSDGDFSGQKQEVSFQTKPILVKLILDKPSVTRVKVSFELTSSYDPTQCDEGYQLLYPHQRCAFSAANSTSAIIGKDVVGLGNGSPAPHDVNGEPLKYISYQPDQNGYLTRGLVTLEPGVQECYIPLEIIDDTFAEQNEAFELALTDVRSGLASLGQGDNGTQIRLTIEDNEPSVTLETLNGGSNDTINLGDAQQYRARLSSSSKAEIHARLINTDSSTARLDSEFTIEQKANDGSWITDPELVFDPGQTAKIFRVRISARDEYSNPNLNDRFFSLTLDEKYQAGRQNFARPSNDSLLRISLNELTAPLVLGTETSFVPTDIALSHDGRLFVTGYDTQDSNRVKARIYDQKGNLLQEVDVTPTANAIPITSIKNGPPVISTVTREVTEGNVKVKRHEFVVVYGTSGPIYGTEQKNGEDVIASLFWFDEASNGGEYVPKWTLRTGTAGDDWVRDVQINDDTGYVVLSGETNGIWPGEASEGGYDSFVQRIDSVVDGGSEVPVVAWTRQVGSVNDDTVSGVDVTGRSALVLGSAKGAVGGASVIGGEDAYFYSADGGTARPAVHQIGSDADESVAAGLVVEKKLWLLGNGNGQYFPVREGDIATLGRTALDSASGFLLGYSTVGGFGNAFTLNDPNDSSIEQFGAVIQFGGDLVAAGTTDGVYSPGATDLTGTQGILSRVSLEISDSAMTDDSRQWRTQLDIGNSAITTLANYRDDEIVALARNGTNWEILLFSPEGRLLTAP